MKCQRVKIDEQKERKRPKRIKLKKSKHYWNLIPVSYQNHGSLVWIKNSGPEIFWSRIFLAKSELFFFSKTWYVIFRSDIIRTFKSSECSIDWRSKTDDWFPTTSVAVQCRHKKHWTHCCYCPPNVWYDRIAKLKTIKVHFHFLPFDLWWSFLTTRVIFLFLPFSDLQFSSLCLSLWYKTAKNVSYQNLKVHLK